jgi:hypothetical protein
MLTVLEGFRNFIKHNVSFLILPTGFQGLSFTSPQTASDGSSLPAIATLTTFLQNINAGHYFSPVITTKSLRQRTGAGFLL